MLVKQFYRKTNSMYLHTRLQINRQSLNKAKTEHNLWIQKLKGAQFALRIVSLMAVVHSMCRSILLSLDVLLSAEITVSRVRGSADMDSP